MRTPFTFSSMTPRSCELLRREDARPDLEREQRPDEIRYVPTARLEIVEQSGNPFSAKETSIHESITEQSFSHQVTEILGEPAAQRRPESCLRSLRNRRGKPFPSRFSEDPFLNTV